MAEQERLERAAAGAKNGDQVRAQMKETRSLAAGYYSWLDHLLELEQMMHSGLSFVPGSVQQREMHGLAVLKVARARIRAGLSRLPEVWGPQQEAAGGLPDLPAPPAGSEEGINDGRTSTHRDRRRRLRRHHRLPQR
jgi:hypothetical protein